MEVDKDLQKRWIEALESGNYKQGKNYLCRKDSEGEIRYCCLGVLCDLAEPDSWNQFESDGVRSIRPDNIGTNRLHNVPPTSISDKVGIFRTGIQSELIRTNDGDGASFQMIANYLRERFEIHNET